MRHHWITVAFLALTTAAFAQKGNSPDAQLGAGLRLEEVEANCKEAIKIYEKLTQDKSTPHAVAARAQLHIGICQEKLGQQQARASYEAVLSKYPDQPEMVQDARGRIGRLPLTASTPAGGKNLRRICVGPDCEGGSISPDGRFLAAPTEEMVAFAFGTSRQVKNTGSLKTTQS